MRISGFRHALTVGLTGGIGCGKSSAAAIFAGLGAGVVDTDIIAHRLTKPGSPALAEIHQAFGSEYVTDDGALNRAKLRQRVFSDNRARAALEAILHPAIRAQAEAEISALKTPYALLVVPLLFETGALRTLVDRVLVVDCAEQQQITRAIQRARGRMAESEVRAIIAAQARRDERLRYADDIIDNSTGTDELDRSVASLHLKYLELATRQGPRAGVNL